MWRKKEEEAKLSLYLIWHKVLERHEVAETYLYAFWTFTPSMDECPVPRTQDIPQDLFDRRLRGSPSQSGCCVCAPFENNSYSWASRLYQSHYTDRAIAASKTRLSLKSYAITRGFNSLIVCYEVTASGHTQPQTLTHWHAYICAYTHTSTVNQSLYRPGQALGGSKRLKLPQFIDNRHMKVARFSALLTRRLYPGDTPGTHFCYRLSRPQGHRAAGRIELLKNPNDPIENRTHDLRLVAQCLNCVTAYFAYIQTYTYIHKNKNKKIKINK